MYIICTMCYSQISPFCRYVQVHMQEKICAMLVQTFLHIFLLEASEVSVQKTAVPPLLPPL